MTDTAPEPGVLLLYSFRYRDPRTGRWLKARYRAELHEIEQRYAEWEIVGEPEVRRVVAGTFSPFR